MKYFDHGAKMRFLCNGAKIAVPKSEKDGHFGEISCHLGQIVPRKPECTEGENF